MPSAPKTERVVVVPFAENALGRKLLEKCEQKAAGLEHMGPDSKGKERRGGRERKERLTDWIKSGLIKISPLPITPH